MINVLFCIFIDALLHSHFVHQTTDIFSICRNFGRIRLRFKARLVIADPMQYLLNPIGKIRKVRSISRTGECTNPSRLSSITASFSRDFIIPVDVLKKFRVGLFKKQYYTLKNVEFDICGIIKTAAFDSNFVPDAETSLRGMESYIREKKF